MPPRKKPAAKTFTNELLEQIRFVGSVLKDSGSPNETHIVFSNGWAVAFNGIISAGVAIKSDLYAAINYTLFEQALAKCKENFSLTIADSSLVVKSEKFKAIVPCLDPSLIFIGGIDENKYSINEEFKKGLEITGSLANDNGQTIHSASILFNGQSLVSTENGVFLFEYWHGCDLPTNIAVPKALVAPLTKTNKKLKGFGYSSTSVTFYFEDDSFIKSQLFKEQWPDLSHVLNNKSNPFDLPKDLWDGLNAVAPHSVDNLVYFDNGIIRSHPNDSVGASYDIQGLPKGPIFNIKQLSFLKDKVQTADFFVKGGQMAYFFGNNCRAVIAGRMSR